MSLQLIEAYIPKKHFEKVDEKLKKFESTSYVVRDHSEEKFLVRMIVKTTDSEEILNYLESIINVIDGFEATLFPVQSHIRRKTEEEIEEENKEKEENRNSIQRASRHELYVKIESMSNVHMNYLLFVVLSSIVVTIGIIKNSSAIVIGGMVIAPLLGPVIALAFGSILGDFKLVRQASLTVFAGVGISLLIAILSGIVLPVPVESEEFVSRMQVDYMDGILALASGAAGALAILRGSPSSLVGVMVAVALLPPTIVLGVTIGAALWEHVLPSLLLLSVNINSILLSAVVVFNLSGIRPIKYDEIQRANNSRKFALIFVSVIFLILLITIFFNNHAYSTKVVG
ncbi:TIGR00341 family protein [Rossellomorea vietnamensis]|uniref:TIGR00341 family protein n=2 Tax=Rossellomorea TaxID=2837508 RepID=A0A5D4KGI5_9BACI|nr:MULTISPECIES: TIGR00341 family protein [Rossellomorea]TYR75373.1 TIGR00341 family protein [Rossellomorea vietnamensis]TYS78329.1 TIGR00341 family protein [Rossellomorea aquimaris]